MSHDGPDTHPHGHQDDRKDTKACCGQTAEDTAQVAAPPPSSGRSFRVNGLDCAEEVAILNKVVGPEVGGSEHLAFDVLNGRMTILESATQPSDDKIIKVVGSTGMSAKAWDAESAEEDQAAHFARQRLFTGVSGGFWAAGFLYHIVETGAGGALLSLIHI